MSPSSMATDSGITLDFSGNKSVISYMSLLLFLSQVTFRHLTRAQMKKVMMTTMATIGMMIGAVILLFHLTVSDGGNNVGLIVLENAANVSSAMVEILF